MKYMVEWQEEVYDAFDDIECIGDEQPFKIKASGSLKKAEVVADREASRKIDEKRPDKSHGTFIARIIALTDENGVRHKLRNRQRVQDYTIIDG